MRFKEYLREATYKTEKTFSDDELLEFIRTECSEWLTSKKPFWRGMTGLADVYLIDCEKSARQSAYGPNYYTVILDHINPPAFPRRSRCLIAANDANKSYTTKYYAHDGTMSKDLYAIIPLNGARIGVCPKEDIWDTPVKIKGPKGHYGPTFSAVNEILNNVYEVPTDVRTFAELVEAIEKKVKYLKTSFGAEDDVFVAGEVANQLETAYAAAPIFAARPSDLAEVNRIPREVWFGDKCIAINASRFKNIERQI